MVFIQSIERHILRNFVFLHAIENGCDIPLGTQDAELLDARTYDEDTDAVIPELFDEDDDDNGGAEAVVPWPLRSEDDYRYRAAKVYAEYTGRYKRRFNWLRPTLFVQDLKNDLLADARALMKVLEACGPWSASRDTKLSALVKLLTKDHPQEKAIVFTQFLEF